MKSFTALFALDVPHCGVAIIEAETAEQALTIAKNLDPVDLVNEPDWSNPVCARILSITDDETNDCVAEDIALDETFLRSGGEPARILCEAAPQMLEALESLILHGLRGKTGEGEWAFEKARAAMEKAKGGAA